jgi:hypothetical protein
VAWNTRFLKPPDNVGALIIKGHRFTVNYWSKERQKLITRTGLKPEDLVAIIPSFTEISTASSTPLYSVDLRKTASFGRPLKFPGIPRTFPLTIEAGSLSLMLGGASSGKTFALTSAGFAMYLALRRVYEEVVVIHVRNTEPTGAVDQYRPILNRMGAEYYAMKFITPSIVNGFKRMYLTSPRVHVIILIDSITDFIGRKPHKTFENVTHGGGWTSGAAALLNDLSEQSSPQTTIIATMRAQYHSAGMQYVWEGASGVANTALGFEHGSCTIYRNRNATGVQVGLRAAELPLTGSGTFLNA